MKRILLVFAMMALVLSGCGNKEKENNESEALTEERIKIITETNDTFTDLRLESEIEWYNDFITPIKESNWKMSKSELESIIKEVNEKRDELNSIDEKEIKQYLEYKYDEFAETGEDPELKEKMEKEATKVPTALEGMNEVLNTIEDDIKLGMDGSFSSEDINKVEDSFNKIMKIYEDKIQ